MRREISSWVGLLIRHGHIRKIFYACVFVTLTVCRCILCEGNLFRGEATSLCIVSMINMFIFAFTSYIVIAIRSLDNFVFFTQIAKVQGYEVMISFNHPS